MLTSPPLIELISWVVTTSELRSGFVCKRIGLRRLKAYRALCLSYSQTCTPTQTTNTHTHTHTHTHTTITIQSAKMMSQSRICMCVLLFWRMHAQRLVLNHVCIACLKHVCVCVCVCVSLSLRVCVCLCVYGVTDLCSLYPIKGPLCWIEIVQELACPCTYAYA